MKHYFLLASAVLFFFSSCQEEPTKQALSHSDLLSTDLVNNPRTANGASSQELVDMPTMDFVDTVFNFGSIKDGDVVVHEFEFKNNGKNPLIISNAKGSCGCTVPEYSVEPIPGGKTGTIKVQFNSAGKSGHQDKSITITTNSNRGIHQLFVKGDVN